MSNEMTEEQQPDLSFEVERKPAGLKVAIPWMTVVALLGLMGYRQVQSASTPTIASEAVLAGHVRERLEERQSAVENRLTAAESVSKAQFEEIIRRLDRIEDRLDKTK